MTYGGSPPVPTATATQTQVATLTPQATLTPLLTATATTASTPTAAATATATPTLPPTATPTPAATATATPALPPTACVRRHVPDLATLDAMTGQYWRQVQIIPAADFQRLAAGPAVPELADDPEGFAQALQQIYGPPAAPCTQLGQLRTGDLIQATGATEIDVVAAPMPATPTPTAAPPTPTAAATATPTPTPTAAATATNTPTPTPTAATATNTPTPTPTAAATATPPTATPTPGAVPVTAEVVVCQPQGAAGDYTCTLRVTFGGALAIDTVWRVGLEGAGFLTTSGAPQVSGSAGCVYPPNPSPYYPGGYYDVNISTDGCQAGAVITLTEAVTGTAGASTTHSVAGLSGTAMGTAQATYVLPAEPAGTPTPRRGGGLPHTYPEPHARPHRHRHPPGGAHRHGHPGGHRHQGAHAAGGDAPRPPAGVGRAAPGAPAGGGAGRLRRHPRGERRAALGGRARGRAGPPRPVTRPPPAPQRTPSPPRPPRRSPAMRRRRTRSAGPPARVRPRPAPAPPPGPAGLRRFRRSSWPGFRGRGPPATQTGRGRSDTNRARWAARGRAPAPSDSARPRGGAPG